MNLIDHRDSPRYIKLHPQDNVGVVVNEPGVAAGTAFADGLTTVEAIPQSHKVSLVGLAEGAEVVRYGEVIGYALQDVPAGSWITEALLRMPEPPALDNLPKPPRPARSANPWKATPSRVSAIRTAASAPATSWR